MQRMHRWVIIVTLCAAGAGCTAGGEPTLPYLVQQTATQAFTEAVQANGFPGGVLGLRRLSDGATLFVASGLAEASSTPTNDPTQWPAAEPMSVDRHTRVASVSKTFTAMMILTLVDEGLLTLDKTIDDFFPGLVPNSDRITLRHLLTMTSGLYDHEDSVPIGRATTCGDLTTYYTPEELIAFSNESGGGEVHFEPGEYYKYTNTNFTILAMIAQEVTGRSYQQLIATRIAEPLGLSNTFAPANDEVTPPSPYMHGYQIPSTMAGAELICEGYDSWWDYSIQNMSWDLGAGSMISTAGDLLRFMSAVYSGELISPELYNEMMTPADVTDFSSGQPSNYGFGISVLPDGRAGHEGSNAGYNTIMIVDGEYAYAIAVNAGSDITFEGKTITTNATTLYVAVRTALSEL